ncbi:MAG: hypothetical protein AAFQ21_13525 [Pseudomonadota bacterium]
MDTSASTLGFELRRVLSFALGLLGAYLLWAAIAESAQLLSTSNGANVLELLLGHHGLALRYLIGVSALIAGVAGLFYSESIAWISAVSAFIFGVLVFALLASRAEVAEWRTSAVSTMIVSGLLLCLIRARLHRELRAAYPDD